MSDPRELIEEARDITPAAAEAAPVDVSQLVHDLADALAAALDERDALRREVVILQYVNRLTIHRAIEHAPELAAVDWQLTKDERAQIAAALAAPEEGNPDA